jgi:CubicO group peptidase (beta-lactamase class C family)
MERALRITVEYPGECVVAMRVRARQQWRAKAARASEYSRFCPEPLDSFTGVTRSPLNEFSMAETFSTARLDRMQDVLARYVANGGIPGMAYLLSRHGETHFMTMGVRGVGSDDAIERDTLFRVTSMTRPVTAVALMILVEECVLRLDDPIDRWLPELANRKVLRKSGATAAELTDVVPAKRSITVRDVLTFRTGYGMSLAPTPIQQAFAARRLVGFGPPDPSNPLSHDAWLQALGEFPLVHQPGERWMYNTASSIGGALIARASGMSLADFFRTRLFEPLGMKNTMFSASAEQRDRLADAYAFDQQTGKLVLYDGHDETSAWANPPAFQDGGAGLLSTIDDYERFAAMMLNYGRRGDVRILSRPSIELMTTDHISAEQKAVSPFFPGFWDDRGWGFGLSVITQRDEISNVPGRFGWDGGFGTSWYSDPREGLTGILMTQVMLNSPDAQGALSDFWTLAYSAIEDR